MLKVCSMKHEVLSMQHAVLSLQKSVSICSACLATSGGPEWEEDAGRTCSYFIVQGCLRLFVCLAFYHQQSTKHNNLNTDFASQHSRANKSHYEDKMIQAGD